MVVSETAPELVMVCPANVSRVVLGDAFEVMTISPEAVPVVVGWKATKRLHDCPEAKANGAAAQAFTPVVSTKGPVTLTALTFNVLAPLLVMALLVDVERCPTCACIIPEMALADRMTCTPVPLSASKALPLLAFETTVNVALRAPTALGVKLITRVQVSAGARLPPAAQVPVREKSAMAAPLNVKEDSVKVAEPVLVSVTVCVALLVPKD